MDTRGLTEREASYIKKYFENNSSKTKAIMITKHQIEELKRKANKNEKVPRRKLFT